MSIYDDFDRKRYTSIVRLLEKDPQPWIETEHFIEAIVANSIKEIPEAVLNNLRARLEASVKKPRGRKKQPYLERFYDDMWINHYAFITRWLEDRRTKYGKKIGCSQFQGKGKSIRNDDNFADTPAWIATAIVRKGRLKRMTPRAIQNLASKRGFTNR